MGKEKKNPVKVLENYLIKKIGTFNFEDVLSAVRDWCNTYHYDFIEKKRSEKGTATGKEIYSEFSGSRDVSWYARYHFKVVIWLRNLKTITVEKDGKKINSNHGHIEINIDTKMEKNYNNSFSKGKGSFGDFLREIYEKYIADDTLKNYEDQLDDESKDLIKRIKKALNIKT